MTIIIIIIIDNSGYEIYCNDEMLEAGNSTNVQKINMRAMAWKIILA